MSKLAKALTAAAGNAGAGALYVEDVFSTYLYTGNGSTQTITNGIDLDGEGGMVWIKARSAAVDHYLFDTERGATKRLITNKTNAEATSATSLTSFNSDGFSLGSLSQVNNNAYNLASWTFRKQPGFFDVVTYTGNSTAGHTIPHNLGTVPGMIIIKWVNTAGDWSVYHRSTGNQTIMRLNSTAGTGSFGSSIVYFNNTDPTSTEFTLGSSSDMNLNGYDYVAYLFAHDAGGFGDDGSESIIKCGSYTGNGSATGPVVTLGYEPQWLMIKETTVGGAGRDWLMFDNMRGMFVSSGSDPVLSANLSNAENVGGGAYLAPTATGFNIQNASGNINGSGNTYIYIAIRRPMKTPESGTEVFAPNTIASSVTDGTQINSGFAIDMNMIALRGGAGVNFVTHDRLRGVSTTTSNGGLYLETTATQAENTGFSRYFNNTGFQLPSTLAGSDLISYSFKRATGFFDVVAYTGDGNYHDWNHNLGVLPEMMIVKRRSSAASWYVWHEGQGADNSYQYLQTTSGIVGYSYLFFNSGANTTTTIRTGNSLNGLGDSYVCYLFATLAGVSKVGSYTGTGSNVDVDCGFSAGARFILIKRTDSTGDWYVWDSARGIVAGNDPYLLLNSTAAEVTSTDYIDPLASGFTVTSSAPAALNASGGTYIFLAIA